MKMLEDILVPVNLKELSSRAIESLKLLQDSFDSRIELMHVVPDSPFYIENAELLEEAVALRLEHIRDSLAQGGVNVAVITIQYGVMFERIIEHALETQKNLIFLDRKNMGEDGADVTIDKILRKALNPVWVVNTGGKASGTVKRILCAYDTSENSARIVKNAIVLARAFSCELHLLHVIEKPDYDWLPGGIDSEVFEKYAEKEIESARSFLSQFVFREVETDEIFRHGLPPYEILDEVKVTTPDLVIIGTRGHSDLRTLLMGLVSEQVIAQLDIPVLTMKAKNVFELPDRAAIENEFGLEELLARAIRLKEAGFLEEAIYYLRKYIKRNNKNLVAYEEIEACYTELGRDKLAADYHAKARRIKDKVWQIKVESEIRGKKR